MPTSLQPLAAFGPTLDIHQPSTSHNEAWPLTFSIVSRIASNTSHQDRMQSARQTVGASKVGFLKPLRTVASEHSHRRWPWSILIEYRDASSYSDRTVWGGTGPVCGCRHVSDRIVAHVILRT